MELINLIAEIQANPRNINALRRLVTYYQNNQKKHEAESFQYLIETKYKNGSNSTDFDKE